ncbi:hypothetical protein EYF80_039048 [Liparis tanakae]|uniref:Uncharacterized protein n=1 Tax=Liparis tanakae TaxID=230148 RepID=A0A4Z2GAV2_9TELE|nr:hypothetical protein EYF80_039048 [Liparis tanakae]
MYVAVASVGFISSSSVRFPSLELRRFPSETPERLSRNRVKPAASLVRCGGCPSKPAQTEARLPPREPASICSVSASIGRRHRALCVPSLMFGLKR